MELQEVRNYKRTLRASINALGLCSCAFFSVLQIKAGFFLMASLSLASIVYFATAIFYLYKRDANLWNGWGFVLVVPGVLLHALYINPDYGVFWVYVSITSIFFMLPLRNATITSIVYLAATTFFIVPNFETSVLLRIYPTVIVVGIFSFNFSYLIERLLRTLSDAAMLDPLTNILNRHTFHEAISTALSEHLRYKVVGVLFLFDLDHFKRINDEHGHLVGDRILEDIAKIVSARVRDTDQFFRYGGEEFAILLRHTSLQNAAFLADDIRQIIEAHSFADDVKVTISGGLSEVDSTLDIDEWIGLSDTALYEAKALGRNCIKIYIPRLRGMAV